MGQVDALSAIIVVVAGLIAAVMDVWKFKVYNALTFPMLASGLIYHGYTGGAAGLGGSLMGLLFGFGALIVIHVMGGMGAGDVKLMAAVGAWLGMPLTFYVFLASAMAGGVYAVVLVLIGGRLGETLVNLQILWLRISTIGRYLGSEDRVELEIGRSDRRRRLIPYAAMVAVGIITTLGWVYLD